MDTTFTRRARDKVRRSLSRFVRKDHGRSSSIIKKVMPRKIQAEAEASSQGDISSMQETIGTESRDEFVPGLRIYTTVRAEGPIDKNFHHQHESSCEFKATKTVCEGLLRRIHHCSRELITRADSKAMEPLRDLQQPCLKVAKYHMAFRIERQGVPWRELHFASFQDQPMTMDAVKEVVLEADRIVALFLQFHDKGFEWVLPPLFDENPLEHTKTTPEIGVPLGTQCIPSYSDVPSYSVDLALKVKNSDSEGSWAVTVNSKNETPLSLNRGESLMAEANRILQQAIKECEGRFDDVHKHCDALEGSYGCRHFQKDGFRMAVRIRNNYGPDYSHLTNDFHSFRLLVHPDQGDAFVQSLERKLEVALADTDRVTNESDELVLNVQEMRGKDWRVRKPLTVSLGPSDLHSRKTIERILERVATGMTDVLRGHGTVATLTAHKRGHFILESKICFGEDCEFYDIKFFASNDQKMRVLRGRLAERMRNDMVTVLKDTISLQKPDPMPEVDIHCPGYVELEPLEDPSRNLQKLFVPHTRKLSKKLPLPDLRRRSLREEEAAGATEVTSGWAVNADIVRDNSYMADMVSRSDSEGIPTPSLVDTASVTLQDDVPTPPLTGGFLGGFHDKEFGARDSEHMEQAQDDDSLSTTGTVIHRERSTSKLDDSALSNVLELASPQRNRYDEARLSAVRHLRKESSVGLRESRERSVSIITGTDIRDSVVSEASWLANQEPQSAQIVNAAAVTDSRHHSETVPQKPNGDRSTATPLADSLAHHNHLTAERKPVHFTLDFVSEERDKANDDDSYAGFDVSNRASSSQGIALASWKARSGEENVSIEVGTGKPQGFFPRRVSALEVAPTQTLVNANGIFHQRRVSSPTGGYLGLHGEWQIGYGIRNAWVPPHLRDPHFERDLHSWLGSVMKKAKTQL